jgi:hypothetical protein
LFAAIAIGACGGSHHDLPSPVTPLQRVIADRQRGSICGDALGQVMQRLFISPSSSPATRLRARRTLDAITAHRASTEPVCASRSSVVVSR